VLQERREEGVGREEKREELKRMMIQCVF